MFFYEQPVKIYFGEGELNNLPERIKQIGKTNGVILCDAFLENSELIKNIMSACSSIKAYSCDVHPNPTDNDVNNFAELLREHDADFIVAIGGGSVMDCAKGACLIAPTNNEIETYHGTQEPFPKEALPIIAVPTTAGTGSEVTSVCVLTNTATNVKAPMSSSLLYPKIAIVDPTLTYTVPKKICISTSLDVLSHAIEAYLSILHQPICDSICIYATKLALENIEDACMNPINKQAKANMMLASLMAGMGFALPKTGPSHACSFVLTNEYNIPHGDACGLTLDYFLRVNAQAENGRMHGFAKLVGFADCYQLCDEIKRIKQNIGALTDLKHLNLNYEDLKNLVLKSKHPNIKNSPVEITDEILETMYKSFT